MIIVFMMIFVPLVLIAGAFAGGKNVIKLEIKKEFRAQCRNYDLTNPELRAFTNEFQDYLDSIK